MSNPDQQPQQVTNLATRYRPRSFASLTGQHHVVAVLRPAIESGTVPQQLLFSGGSGLGKTTVARIVASAVLCLTPVNERPGCDPCGSCASCSAMAEDRHPDFVEFDAASHGGKDEIRDIAARALVGPLLSGRRVYVIDEAHGLTPAGGQAFLKLLEEPPDHVLFMLCTTDPERMLKTNRGRCTELELRRPTRRELLSNLSRVCAAEGWAVDNQVLELVVDCSDPDLGVRGTVNTLSKIATQLRDGEADLTLVAALLGQAPQDQLDDLAQAVASGSGALNSLDVLRQHTPDEAIRQGLLRWLRRELSTPQRVADRARSLQLFDDLLHLRDGSAWLDLWVARTETRSETEPAVGGHRRSAPLEARPTRPAAAGSQVAERAHPNGPSEPTNAYRSTSTTRETVESGARPAAVAVPAGEMAPARQARPVAQELTVKPAVPVARNTPVDKTDKPVSRISAPTPPPPSVTPADPREAFVLAVRQLDPELAGALRRCELEIGESVIVRCPSALLEQVQAGERVLRQISGRAGLAVQVRVL